MTRSIFFCVFLVVSSILQLCYAVEFKDCGSKIGHFTKITISNCDTSKTACELVRNSNVSLTIDFIPSQDISKIEAVIHGVIADVPIPFPLSHPDVCTNPESNIQCPLKKDTEYTYKAVLPVENTYPKLSLKVRWELQDENKQDIICVSIPAKIK
ncbi:PREDICTED: protein NPC2 homolog [Polistes dominula]|uniref:Protein NPC2 homolog n=1 Tax=Polistes dominula TaxID=743375 RepID=A0ABM1IFX7_POLDO|nr:PREDICTED: protein NPC2 homolog [Polistes dominula]